MKYLVTVCQTVGSLENFWYFIVPYEGDEDFVAQIHRRLSKGYKGRIRPARIEGSGIGKAYIHPTEIGNAVVKVVERVICISELSNTERRVLLKAGVVQE